VTGKTVGSTGLYPASNRLDRVEALRRYTLGSAWFSGEEMKKGSIEVDKLADLSVLSEDYFSIPEERIKVLEAVLVQLAGRWTQDRATEHNGNDLEVLTFRAVEILADQKSSMNFCVQLKLAECVRVFLTQPAYPFDQIMSR
jgi:urease alpha subunit